MASAPKYGVSAALPSKEELALIEQIRSACRKEIDALSIKADDIVGDLRLCRFLRAKDGDVRGATDWFREFLVWRVTSSMETDRLEVVGRSPEDFMSWFSKRCNPYLPMCPYVGRNREGHVIFYIRPGRLHAKKFLSHRQYPKEDDQRVFFQVLEWLLWYLDVLSRAEGRMVYAVKMADFGGLGEEGRALPVFVPEFKAFFVGLAKSMQKYFCDHDSLFVLINTNLLFRAMYAVMRFILTKRQTSKFRMLGDASQASVRKNLQEYIPEALLPPECGGTLQKAVVAYPIWTAEQIEEWYKKRHLVIPEPAPSQDVFADALEDGRPKAEEASPPASATTASPLEAASPASAPPATDQSSPQVSTCSRHELPEVEEMAEPATSCGFLCNR